MHNNASERLTSTDNKGLRGAAFDHTPSLPLKGRCERITDGGRIVSQALSVTRLFSLISSSLVVWPLVRRLEATSGNESNAGRRA